MIYRIIFTVILLCATQCLHAQEDEYGDIVELSNGTRVFGKIIENKKGEQVIIKSRVGTIFTFKSDEIKNIIERKKSAEKQALKLEGDASIDPRARATQQDSTSENVTPRQQRNEQSIIRQHDTYLYETSDTLNLRVDIGAGYTYRMAKVGDNIPSAFKDYVTKLKSGFNITVNISYYVSEEYGVCLGYSRFMTSNSMNGVYVYDPGAMTPRGPGIMKDNITIPYYGLGMAAREIFSDGGILLVGNFTVGIASYNNDSKLLDDSYKIEGSTFAYTGLVNLDFMLTRNLALGFGISYLGGTLRDSKINGISTKLGEENLFRLDFNAGVKIYY